MAEKRSSSAGGAGANDDGVVGFQKQHYRKSIADEKQASPATTPWPVPIRIDPYIDQIQYWFMTPWNERKMDKFGSRYGTPIYIATDKHGDPKPAMRVRERVYRQCLHACLPTWEFVEALAEFNPYLNQVEFALDLNYSSAKETNSAEDYFDRYLIKKNSGRQSVSYATGENGAQNLPQHRDRGLATRYVGDRRAADADHRRAWDANVLVQYQRVPKLDPLSEQFALHIEWVVSGAPALRRIGINPNEITDLLALDRYKFWKPRLLLADIDRVALARQWHNHSAGRRVWCNDPLYDGDWLYRVAQLGGRDKETGLHKNHLHPFFSESGSSQNVIAKYSKTADGKPFLPIVSQCLIRLPVEHLSPTPGSFLRRQNPMWSAPVPTI
jgi:hypothetical protein